MIGSRWFIVLKHSSLVYDETKECRVIHSESFED